MLTLLPITNAGGGEGGGGEGGGGDGSGPLTNATTTSTSTQRRVALRILQPLTAKADLARSLPMMKRSVSIVGLRPPSRALASLLLTHDGPLAERTHD